MKTEIKKTHGSPRHIYSGMQSIKMTRNTRDLKVTDFTPLICDINLKQTAFTDVSPVSVLSMNARATRPVPLTFRMSGILEQVRTQPSHIY